MLIGRFTEQPRQKEKTGMVGRSGNTTLDIGNSLYDQEMGA